MRDDSKCPQPAPWPERVLWIAHGQLAPVEWVRWLAAATVSGLIEVV